MRHRLFYASGLLALATLVLVPAAEAQTTAVGPYYATPSWDQTFACTAPATCPRFIVLSNFSSQAVLDRETGLVWERSPDPTTRDWADALSHCVARVVSNRSGWRLPSIQELLSLRAAASGDTLPAGHPFFNVDLPYYWAATTRGVYAWNSWFSFAAGDGVSLHTKVSDYSGAWCVRGGQSADVQ